MKTRPLYFLTCALAVVGIVVSCASVVQARRAIAWAASAAAVDSPDDRAALHSTALVHARASDRLYLVAATVFVAAFGGWVTSRFRREVGWQAIPLLLLCVAGLFQFLLL